ncbi:MAG: hypothetical protein PHQ36_05680 [Anaerolineales bacterium]|nr:hypothetical protein [Anaerolineales bacterium]
MNHLEWREKFLEAVAACSNEGREAAEYIRARGTYIGLRGARKNVGAFWVLTRSIYFNAAHYSREDSIANPAAWTLLIHEVKHLQQGFFTALSIYGELEAWQIQFRLYKKITGQNLHPALEEIVSLPLNMERENLRRARKLMTDYAGVMYGANLYPLYPLHREIKYWLTRK